MNLGVSAARPKSNLHSLDPSVGGTGPHGLTVRDVPHVLRPKASIATRLPSGDEWPSRPPCRGGLASLNHNFSIAKRRIFLPAELDSSGKTGGVFFVCPSCRSVNTSINSQAQSHPDGGDVRFTLEAGIIRQIGHVRFVPTSRHQNDLFDHLVRAHKERLRYLQIHAS